MKYLFFISLIAVVLLGAGCGTVIYDDEGCPLNSSDSLREKCLRVNECREAGGMPSYDYYGSIERYHGCDFPEPKE